MDRSAGRFIFLFPPPFGIMRMDVIILLFYIRGDYHVEF